MPQQVKVTVAIRVLKSSTTATGLNVLSFKRPGAGKMAQWFRMRVCIFVQSPGPHKVAGESPLPRAVLWSHAPSCTHTPAHYLFLSSKSLVTRRKRQAGLRPCLKDSTACVALLCISYYIYRFCVRRGCGSVNWQAGVGAEPFNPSTGTVEASRFLNESNLVYTVRFRPARAT